MGTPETQEYLTTKSRRATIARLPVMSGL